MTARDVIDMLGLRPLPEEGGLFVETFRDTHRLPPDALPPAYRGPRALSTAIYYLLTREMISAVHRVPGTEVFHFYLGAPVRLLRLHPGGAGDVATLGMDLRAGQRPQVVVPGGVWQGLRLADEGEFALLGTTMAPGFDFQDFELGDCDALLAGWPAFADEIRRLTRD